MSLNKIDHVGIAVTDLDKSIELYKAMGFEFQKVKTAFFKIGESMIELLAATDPASPIAKFIEKNGNRGGIAHMAIHVSDVQSKLSELKQKGFQLIDEVAKDGAHGTKIAFVHPKSTGGVLLELCEKKEH